MISPFDNPVPKGYMRQIEEYARDLAWGVEEGLWEQQFMQWADTTNKRFVYPIVDGFPTNAPSGQGGVPFLVEPLDKSKMSELVQKNFAKWEDYAQIPSTNRLEFWGYIERGGRWYDITREAFYLLREPISTPKVFISYRHETSSAFSLAIEARLRVVGVGHQDVFIDKDIPEGAIWSDVLEDKIIKCDYFVLLVGELELFTLSDWTKKEFELAQAQSKNIIPILHPKLNPEQFPEFEDIQCILCGDKESAASYEYAINRLLSRLGYPTY